MCFQGCWRAVEPSKIPGTIADRALVQLLEPALNALVTEDSLVAGPAMVPKAARPSLGTASSIGTAPDAAALFTASVGDAAGTVAGQKRPRTGETNPVSRKLILRYPAADTSSSSMLGTSPAAQIPVGVGDSLKRRRPAMSSPVDLTAHVIGDACGSGTENREGEATSTILQNLRQDLQRALVRAEAAEREQDEERRNRASAERQLRRLELCFDGDKGQRAAPMVSPASMPFQQQQQQQRLEEAMEPREELAQARKAIAELTHQQHAAPDETKRATGKLHAMTARLARTKMIADQAARTHLAEVTLLRAELLVARKCGEAMLQLR